VSTLKTARVPPGFEEVFASAERVVSRYFDERVEDPTHGTIEIAGERYVLVRAASLSVEFFALVENLYGPGREPEAHDFARNILFDLAHAIGKSDARNFHTKMQLDDPVARLSAGPIHFAHSGWAFVDIDESSNPEPGPGFVMLYDHPYSFESDAWRRDGRKVSFPVCIMNAGYSSGWCEESFGVSLVASEVLCRAKGDDCCRFIMAPPEQIEQRVQDYIAGEPALAARIRGYQIPDFFARKHIEEELRAARDDLEQRVRERTRDLRDANERLRGEMLDRERVERQLQNTQRLESLGRLAGGVAHDFNNLLGVIMGYSSILQRRVPESDPMHAMLAEVTEAAQLAANLTRQLLTFSRAQVVSKRRIDLNEVVVELLKMLRRLVGDDVVVDSRLFRGAAIIEAEVSQIEQVLMNLAVNARDAMPNGGTLTIETRLVDDEIAESQRVQLIVADTGVGMDERTQSKIFEPFFTTKRGGEGTGLGLSTVYGIVAQAGGSVGVESEPGKGSRFVVELPIAEGDRSLDSEGAVFVAVERRTETVLLVEDRIGFRALMANLLTDEGYTVLVAHDTADALRIAEQHPGPIHVLLSDVVMPSMKGPELAEQVRRGRPDIKVLFMSGYAGDSEELERNLVVGARFLRKPFTPDELDRELRVLLAGPEKT
jgi:signal transduction histidine kinase